MRVFVYGTLTDPARASAVLETWSYESAAVLKGLHRVEGTYPTLAPGGSTAGRLLRTPERDRLDAYEGVDRGLYVRESIPSDTGPIEVYIGDPDRLEAPGTWPGTGAFPDRVRHYIAANDVFVRRATPAP